MGLAVRLKAVWLALAPFVSLRLLCCLPRWQPARWRCSPVAAVSIKPQSSLCLPSLNPAGGRLRARSAHRPPPRPAGAAAAPGGVAGAGGGRRAAAAHLLFVPAAVRHLRWASRWHILADCATCMFLVERCRHLSDGELGLITASLLAWLLTLHTRCFAFPAAVGECLMMLPQQLKLLE